MSQLRCPLVAGEWYWTVVILKQACTSRVHAMQAKWMGKTPKNRRKLRNLNAKKLSSPASAIGGDTVVAHA